jgi:phosphonate metabolism protein PhnN/1,5-bisphosphokinase (PRPP-forming)
MLVLVVGPSGAGKDTVLGLARQALAGDTRFRFVRRVITRPADAGGEDHEAVSEAEFAQRRFALSWGAHGLRYGIPIDVVDDLARGSVVVANVSRGVIAEAAAAYSVRVIVVTASPEILARRLAARGRETAEDIARRLARDAAIPDGVAVDTVVNDGMPEEAAGRFVIALNRATLCDGRG